jgi:hypothetical protein
MEAHTKPVIIQHKAERIGQQQQSFYIQMP